MLFPHSSEIVHDDLKATTGLDTWSLEIAPVPGEGKVVSMHPLAPRKGNPAPLEVSNENPHRQSSETDEFT